MHDTFLAECRSAIGAEHVWTQSAHTFRFAHDFWGQYEGRAAAVLRPGSTTEAAALMALASTHHVPIVPQAGNTGLVNGGIPDDSGGEVVLSVERLNRIRAIDPAGELPDRRYEAHLFGRVGLDGKDEERIFIDATKKLRQVLECHLMAGDNHFLLRVVAPNLEG